MTMFDYAQVLIKKFQTSDPEELLEILGVRVQAFPMQGVRGIYKWLNGWPTVFVDSRLRDQERQFVLAHELAHFLFHRGQNRVFLDRRTFLKPSSFEKEADLFAACLLYPFPDQFFHDGVTVKEISQMLQLEEPAAALYCQEYQKTKK